MPCILHPDLPTTGDLIRAQRKMAGLTEEQVADLMGVHQSTVDRWENDDTVPTFDHLRQLAHLFGCTINQLSGHVCGGSPDMQ